MDDVSIKILDILYDLCENDGYQILEADEFFARLPDHDFGPDELETIFEGLSADDLIDLKYADTNEFCIALKLKGRTLIKQSRDRLSQIVGGSFYNSEDMQVKKIARITNAAKAAIKVKEVTEEKDLAEDAEDDSESIESDSIVSAKEQEEASDAISIDDAQSATANDKISQQKVKSNLINKTEQKQEVPIHERVCVQTSPNLARGFTATSAISDAVGESKKPINYGKIFLAALAGSFFGTALLMGGLYLLKYFGVL